MSLAFLKCLKIKDTSNSRYLIFFNVYAKESIKGTKP